MSFCGWLDHPDVAHLKPCGFYWRGSRVAPQRSPCPADPGPVICRRAPRPQITAFESSPSMDERGTRLKGSCRGKCHSCQLVWNPPIPLQTEVKKKITWWRSDSKHFTVPSIPSLSASIRTLWRWGCGFLKLIAHHLEKKNDNSRRGAVSSGQGTPPFPSFPRFI